jgi:hypothetical protein
MPGVVVLFLAIVLSLLGLWAFYWMVRLAVRHGMEDAWRRRDEPAGGRASGYWDPANADGSIEAIDPAPLPDAPQS